LAGLKRKILMVVAAMVVVVVGMVVNQQRIDRLATFQGIHARAWAVDFYPNFDPRSTNVATTAFQAMGAHAVPPLRSMLRTRESWYEKLFVQQGKRLPVSARSYLSGKIKPGRSVMYRVTAARALGVVGTNATAAVPDLAEALTDSEVRWSAAQALASIGGPAIPALISATTNKDDNVRHAAVYGLGQAGTIAWPATEALLERVLDTNQLIQASAIYSLGQIGPRGLPMVLESFSADNTQRREAAAKAIKTMGTPPSQVWRTLIEYSTNAAPSLRQNSLEALRTLGINHPRVVANYFEAATDSDAGVRAAAARALGQANDWSTNARLSDTVVRLLGRNGNLDSNAVATLTALLSDAEAPVRDAARQTLARLQASSAN
jgi:HEAT repeat protein